MIEALADYEAALARAASLMDAEPGPAEEAELLELADRIEAYEALHFPIDPPTPEEAALFRAEQEAAPPPTDSHDAA